jgi:hypothetical protein
MQYTIEDAAQLERAYYQLPNNDTQSARLARSAFRQALDLLGVAFVYHDARGCHPFRVLKAGGREADRRGREYVRRQVRGVRFCN